MNISAWLSEQTLTRAGHIVLMCLCAWLAYMALVAITNRFIHILGATSRKDISVETRMRTLSILITRSGLVLILLCTGALVLKELNIDITPLLAGAGIVGLIVSFASQTAFKDMAAGIFILAEHQYAEGDTVEIGDAAGTVERLSLRRTTLRDKHGDLYYIPHGSIVMVKVYNQGKKK